MPQDASEKTPAERRWETRRAKYGANGRSRLSVKSAGILCSVPECARTVKASGMCSMHYARQKLHGDVNGRPKGPASCCSVPDCGKPVEGRGYCLKHYKRLVRHGDINVRHRAANGEREAWIRDSLNDHGDECRIWTINPVLQTFTVDGKRMVASRWVCEQAHGNPPTPLHQATHSCGQGHLGCLNPGHLRWGTNTENQHDRIAHETTNRGRRNGANKLTEEQVREIRQLDPGMGPSRVAEMFDVHPNTIRDIRKGRRWAWLT